MNRCYIRHWLSLALITVATASHADPFVASPGDEPKFESTFSDYVPDDDIEPGGWREANELVERIGGWRTYLKEAEDRPDQPDRQRPAMVGERVPADEEGK